MDADDLLPAIFYWTGLSWYSTFADLAASDSAMAIVQSDSHAMAIIECNEEAMSYFPKELFDFGDWTNSEWTVNSWAQSNISKQTDRISFYNSSNYISSYLSQYEIDWTKDFLLEMRAYLPSTSAGYHFLTLDTAEWNNTYIWFRTRRESRGTLFCSVNWSDYAWVSNPWTQDFFIKKEWNTLSMGRWGVVKYTTTHTFASKYYLNESVYRDTITIYTAKLTYL